MEFQNLYLNYTEYKALGGTLEEMPFNILEFKAQKIIDKHTLDRLKGLENQNQEVKMCVYELINILRNYDQSTNNAGITSENIDGYSVTYENNSNENSKSFNFNIKSCIRNYLADCKLDDGTPFLYCGVN